MSTALLAGMRSNNCMNKDEIPFKMTTYCTLERRWLNTSTCPIGHTFACLLSGINGAKRAKLKMLPMFQRHDPILHHLCLVCICLHILVQGDTLLLYLHHIGICGHLCERELHTFLGMSQSLITFIHAFHAKNCALHCQGARSMANKNWIGLLSSMVLTLPVQMKITTGKQVASNHQANTLKSINLHF